jgi:hypothetical protein
MLHEAQRDEVKKEEAPITLFLQSKEELGRKGGQLFADFDFRG